MTAPAAAVPPAPPAAPAGSTSLDDAIAHAQAVIDAARPAATADPALAAAIAPTAEGDPAVAAPSGEPPAPPKVNRADPNAPPVPSASGAAAEGGEGTPAGEPGEGGDEAQPTDFATVELPGRRPEDPPFTIEIPKGEPEERLRQLVNSGMRGDQYDAAMGEVEQQRAEIEAEADQLAVDPLGYLGPRLAPDDRSTLALHLLADPEVLQLAVDRLGQLLDPDQRDGVVKDLRLERSESQQERSDAVRERGLLRQARNEISDLIQALTPTTLTDAQATLFRRDAVGDIQAVLQRSRNGFVHPRDVPRILTPRLKAFGMTDDQIGSAVLSLSREGRTRGRRLAAPPPAPPAPAPARAVARPTPQQLEAGARARASVRTPPPGAGVPAAARQVPSNLTVEQAVDAWRSTRARPA